MLFRSRTKSEIEYRLNDPRFRQGAAEFKKIPIFIFELIFMRDRVVAHKCLMLLTSKQIIPLPCRRSQCDHEFTIPRAKLSFSSKSPYGFDVKDLCDFVSSNVRKEHFPYLRRNIYSMEDFLSAANVDYRNMMPSGENQPAKVVVTKDNLKNLVVDKPSPITVALAQKSDKDGLFAFGGENVTRGNLKNLVVDKPSPITVALA